MKNRITIRRYRRLLVLATLGLALASPSFALPIQPPGLQPGQLYHWMFVTRGERDGASADITDYNAFVLSEAAMNPGLSGTNEGVQWYAIASTETVDARDNAVVQGPVYLFDGTRFARFFLDQSAFLVNLYDGLHKGIAPSIDQFGVERPENPQHPFPFVWTGSASDGTAAAPLGGNSAMYGQYTSFIGTNWIRQAHSSPEFFHRPLYALSSPIKAEFDTTVPEPAGWLLFAMGVSFLVAFRLRRKTCTD